MLERIVAWLIELTLIFATAGLLHVRRRFKEREVEKLWREASFEWQGGRYNKAFFEVIDGQLAQK